MNARRARGWLYGAALLSGMSAAQSLDCTAPVAPTLSNPVVLGNGSAGSVTPAQLQAALDAGGAIRLNIGTSTLALGAQLLIGRATTLDGGGATLSGQGLTRLIDLRNPQQSTDLTINLLNLRLVNGNARTAAGNEFARSGGAILNDHGGEPWRAMRLRLFNVELRDSLAVQTAQDGGGGGLYVTGLKELTLVNSIVANNQGSNGGGIYSLGSELVQLFDSTVQGNTATGTGGNPGNGGNAGGIGIDGATRTLRLCRVQLLDNTANAYGGGLFTVAYDQQSFVGIGESRIAGNNSAGSSNAHTGGVYLQGGPFLIRASTFAGNQASGFGGLALFDHQTGNGLITTGGDIINSTFTGNRARTSLGGAMGISATGALRLLNLTIADNVAECSVCFAGGIQNAPGLNITLRNSILHNNLGGNAFNPWNLRNPVNGSHNLQWPQERPGSFGQMELPVTPGAVFAPAQLAALADNGGPTPTRALLDGSPALDTGTTTEAPATDQRGLPRVAPIDLGAFERQPLGLVFAHGFE